MEHICTVELPEMPALAEGGCPVDWALRCIRLARASACGKSVMCRDGLTQLALMAEDAVSGRSQPDDIPLMRELCQVIAAAGGCPLAQKAAENVLYTLREYADVWEQHSRRKRCPAMVCKAYYTVYCDPDKCQGCTKCMEVCPAGAISGGEGLICVVDGDKCVRCGKCVEVCPHEARGKYGAVKPRLPEQPVAVGSFSAAPAGGRRRRRSSSAAEPGRGE